MKWDSTEAPLTVTVDDPDAYSGHMDDKPLKLSVAPPEAVQVSMSPGEAYHLVDDLQDAADACWGAAEYVVMATNPNPEYQDAYLTTTKAPSPEQAVKRAVEYVQRAAEDDRERWGDVAHLAITTDRFQVYRADSLTTVQKQTDDNDDN
jgi:hypothetical protein